MGYIVYNTVSGRAERYYKLERTAKQQATKRNRDAIRAGYEAGEYRSISYAAYEGVLLGLRGDNLRYWEWLSNGRRG